MRAEAEAVEQIMRMVREGFATWVSSMVLNIEISRNPDPDRRREAEALRELSVNLRSQVGFGSGEELRQQKLPGA